MKKWLSLLLIGCLILCACSSKQAKYQEQYDLGVKYLSEGNYEEAVIAFTAAIEIDAKQAAAYVGRGDSYMGLAGQANDEAQREAYYGNAAADYQMAADLGDETGTEKLQQVQLVMSSQEFLRTLYATFAAGDLEQAQELMTQETYRQLAGSINEGHLYYGERDEYGLAIYPNYYCYFGQWKDGQRSGEGIWTNSYGGYEEDGSPYLVTYSYQGEWTNDKPNGSGQINSRQIDKYWDMYSEMRGKFVDGKAIGIVQTTDELNGKGKNSGTKEDNKIKGNYINGRADGEYYHMCIEEFRGRTDITEIWGQFKDGYYCGKERQKTVDADGKVWEYQRDIEKSQYRKELYIKGLDDTEDKESTNTEGSQEE